MTDIPAYLPVPDLPEGAMPTACVVVVTYFDQDGTNKYMVGVKGEAPMTAYLGMTVIAQQQISQWANE